MIYPFYNLIILETPWCFCHQCVYQSTGTYVLHHHHLWYWLCMYFSWVIGLMKILKKINLYSYHTYINHNFLMASSIMLTASYYNYNLHLPVCYQLIISYCSRINDRHFLRSQIARSIGPTWSPSWADRTQVGPMLAPLILLSGTWSGIIFINCRVLINKYMYGLFFLWFVVIW